MPLADTIGRYVPWLAPGKPKRSRGESLKLRPIRNPAVLWKPKENAADTDSSDVPPSNEPKSLAQQAGPVVLERPGRDDVVGRAISAVFKISGSKLIELDEFGSEIWMLCDGSRRVEELVAHTCRKYKLNERQAEVSVTAFMRMLSSRRLIGFIAEEKRDGVSPGKRPAKQSGKRPSRRRH